jgi:uncharacterized membrane protein
MYRLGAGSLWYDETVSAYLASKSVPGLIAHTAGDIHPPGYYLLLHAWTRLAGDTEFSLSFLSLLFSMLLLALTYTIARRLLGSSVALWSGLLVTISPYHVWYSQEVRMYTLGAALGLMCLWFALTVSRMGKPRYARQHADQHVARIDIPPFAAYTLAAAAGLYVLYYFAFLLMALNVYVITHLLLTHERHRLGAWLLAQAAAILLYLPWLPVAWRQMTNSPVPPWRSPIPLPSILLESWTALSLGQSVQPGQIWPLLVITGLLCLLGFQFQISKSRLSNHPSPISHLQSPVLLITYTFGPLLLVCLASTITPLYHVRYLFTYSPPFYIILGAGLAWLACRTRPLAVVAALALLGGSAFSLYQMHTNPRYAPDDFRSAVGFIAKHWRPGDAILINAGYAYTGFLFYYDAPLAGSARLTQYQTGDETSARVFERPLLLTTGIVGGDPTLGWGNPDSDFYATTQADTVAALNRVAKFFPRLWVLRIYDTVSDPQGLIRDWLAANMTPFEDQLFAGESSMRVQGFMSSTQPSLSQHDEITLEGGISLVGWEPGSERAQRAGNPLDVVLWWRVEDSSAVRDTPYAVSLKLWGPESPGSEEPKLPLAAQQDEWPIGSLFLTSDWPPRHSIRHPMRLWLPRDLPSGDYWLNVEMYDPTTVQPLPRRDGMGHTISLGSFAIEASKVYATSDGL